MHVRVMHIMQLFFFFFFFFFVLVDNGEQKDGLMTVKNTTALNNQILLVCLNNVCLLLNIAC